jgi:hypothetical protein
MGTNILKGTVQSGDTAGTNPQPDLLVTLYQAAQTAPVVVGTATTDQAGNFSLDASGATSGNVFYATATRDDGVKLATIIGLSIPDSITINELTTVAAAFSFAQFTREGVIAGNSFGLGIAAGMNDNLVSPPSGAPSDVLTSSPNGNETNSLRSTRALANLLASCVQSQPGAVPNLFALTTPPGGVAPTDTLQALVNICLYPANNVADIYTQSQALEIYSPSLEHMPDAWTIAVKVNASGDTKEMLFGGPGNLVFDKNGYAWITNNVVQGTPDSARYNIVLKPNGKPADGKNGTPTSPITGGGILGGGFGIEIDTHGTVWMGNFGWGGKTSDIPSAKGNGSVSRFDGDGKPISGTEGDQGGVVRAQGIVSDQDNNMWIASNGSNQVFVFLKGDLESSLSFPVDVPDDKNPDDEKYPKCPFDIALAPDGSGAWVTYSGGLQDSSAGSLCKYIIENGALTRVLSVAKGPAGESFQSVKGMSLDSQGNAWIASGGQGVYLVSSDGATVSGPFTGGGISGPWSVTVDGDDNVWVANFGPMEADSVYGNDDTMAAISKLAGANSKTWPPGCTMAGDPISPLNGYTLPSAGDEVRLNGVSLYGPGRPPCYSPLMRQTNCLIDQAGNVWALNNWKPNFDVDVDPDVGNPGGDGVVIFVGLAKPPIKKH